MAENSIKTAKVIGTPFEKGKTGNPNGRPLGTRNFKTVMREAMVKIAESNKMTVEELEAELQKVGLKHALKGNFQFYKDITDRTYGKTPDVSQINLVVEPNERIKKLAKKLNG